MTNQKQPGQPNQPSSQRPGQRVGRAAFGQLRSLSRCTSYNFEIVGIAPAGIAVARCGNYDA
jgi:hypothetical protein